MWLEGRSANSTSGATVFSLREIPRFEEQREPFELRDAGVGGRGLQAGYEDADWSRIREVSYEGRGG